MGRDKASLPAPGGATLLEWMLNRLQGSADEIIVAGGQSTSLPDAVRRVPDAIPGWGPLGGMLAGLREVSAPYVWVLACDLPEVTPALADLLFGRAQGREAAVPRVAGRVQGLCAVYASGIAERLEQFLSAGGRAVHELVDELDVVFLNEDELRTVDPALRSLTNLNTPDDHERWLRTAGN
jgi:molybdopterin-guanine dinucleotide biosynthesis protein A